jgi:proprotein convertase subtilisin/kexin type 5
MPCDTICLTCDIISLNCTSCGIQAGIQTYLQTLFSFCSPICAISYQNSPNFNCDTCDVSCSSCTSTVKGFCITCNINQGYVLSYTSNTTCLSKCSSNQYKDTILMQCRPCDTACASCTSNTSALCITCNNSLGYIK